MTSCLGGELVELSEQHATRSEGHTTSGLCVKRSDLERTVAKGLPNVILHFQHVCVVDLGGVHELALVRAARQLTEEVHQVGEAGGTPATQGFIDNFISNLPIKEADPVRLILCAISLLLTDTSFISSNRAAYRERNCRGSCRLPFRVFNWVTSQHKL